MAKIKKNQNSKRNEGRDTGVIIDCDEITISVFPPPREHGKVYLDGSVPDIITEGFSKRDMELIGDIIFNEPEKGQISNDEYLERKWEELHNDES